MKRLSEGCRRGRERLSLLAAGALSAAEQAEANRHLAGCEECRRDFAKVQTLSRALGALPKTALPLSLRAAWSARWKRQILEEETTRPAGSAASGWTWIGWIFGRRAPLGALVATWALAAFFRLSAPALPTADHGPAVVALHQVWQMLKAQRQELAEWRQGYESAPPPTPADRPRRSSPRSDVLSTATIA